MPTHPPTCTGPEDILRRRASNAFRAAFVLSALVVLSACEQNAFVPPPPPKVEVGPPTQRAITRYLEATGTTPDAFAALVKTEIAKWMKVARAAKLAAQ